MSEPNVNRLDDSAPVARSPVPVRRDRRMWTITDPVEAWNLAARAMPVRSPFHPPLHAGELPGTPPPHPQRSVSASGDAPKASRGKGGRTGMKRAGRPNVPKTFGSRSK